MKKKVLISGGGMSGFVAYYSLDRSKYDVTLVEKVDNFKSVGYSIVLWNGAYNIVKKLILDKAPQYESYLSKMETTPSINTKVGRFAWSFENLGYFVNREDLLNMFVQESANLEGEIHKNCYITNVFYEGNKSRVVFDNGEEEIYDIVLNCEGVHSSLRNLSGNTAVVKDPEHAVEYVYLERIKELEKRNFVFQTADFTGNIMTPHNSSIMAYFFRKDMDNFKQKRQDFYDSLPKLLKKSGFKNLKVKIDEKSAKIFYPKEVYAKKYFSGNIVHLGDAIHGRLPVLGFGTMLAIEDAYLLSSLLNQMNVNHWENNLTNVLGKYTKKRKKRVDYLYFIQKQASKNVLPQRKHKNMPENYQQPFYKKKITDFLDALSIKLFTHIVEYDIEKDIHKN